MDTFAQWMWIPRGGSAPAVKQVISTPWRMGDICLWKNTEVANLTSSWGFKCPVPQLWKFWKFGLSLQIKLGSTGGGVRTEMPQGRSGFRGIQDVSTMTSAAGRSPQEPLKTAIEGRWGQPSGWQREEGESRSGSSKYMRRKQHRRKEVPRRCSRGRRRKREW